MKRKYTKYSMIVVVLFLAVLIGLCIHFYQNSHIDWSLHGVWVSESGEVTEDVTIRISGRVPAAKDAFESQEIELDIIWPENSFLQSVGPQTHRATAWMAEHNYYVVQGFTQTQTGIPARTVFALSLEKGYFMMECLDSRSNRYFLASRESNVNTDEILEYFSDYFSQSE